MYLVITPSKQDTFIKNLDAHVSHAIVLSDVQNNIFFAFAPVIIINISTFSHSNFLLRLHS